MPKTNAKKLEYQHEYRNTYEGLKRLMLGKWQIRGVIPTDYYTLDELFDCWLWCPECENCGVELAPVGTPRTVNSRCLDHNHKTRIFRNILCHSCNIKRSHYESD